MYNGTTPKEVRTGKGICTFNSFAVQLAELHEILQEQHCTHNLFRLVQQLGVSGMQLAHKGTSTTSGG